MIFTHFWKLFSDDFCVWFLCLAGGAGASAHLEKTANGIESVAFFACRPFSRGSEKVKICMKSTIKKHLENRTTKRLRKTSKNIKFLTKIESKSLPKSIPEGSGGLLRAVGRLEPPKMVQKSPPERLRSDFSSKINPPRPHPRENPDPLVALARRLYHIRRSRETLPTPNAPRESCRL